MNICLVSQNYPPDTAHGGISTQTWNKARALAGLGHDVDVLSCAAGPGPDLIATVDDGVTVHRIQPPGQESRREFETYREETYWLGYSWSILRHLRSLLERKQLDVIDFPDYCAEGFVFQMDRILKEPAVVVQLHAPLAILAEHIGWPEKESAFYRSAIFMEGVSIKSADGLMSCSANIADFTSQFYEVPRDSIDVVHCGVDAEAFHPRSTPAKSAHSPTVLFVGNVAGNKGVESLFEAVLQLRSKYPALRLQVLGNCNDRLIEDFRERAHAAGASSNLEFHGFVGRPSLPEFYRRADVFCSPAQYEGGVANVYLEAMASGCPVIASTAGGAPEAVVEGETGLLVPPNDSQAVADAIDRILSDATFHQRLSLEGRRSVEDYFAMDKYMLRVLSTYEKAIERRRQNRQRFETDWDEAQSLCVGA